MGQMSKSHVTFLLIFLETYLEEFEANTYAQVTTFSCRYVFAKQLGLAKSVDI